MNTELVNVFQTRKSPWHAVKLPAFNLCLKEGLVPACKMRMPTVPQYQSKGPGEGQLVRASVGAPLCLLAYFLGVGA